MEKFKTHKEIEAHLDKLIEESSVKVEEATEEVTEEIQKKNYQRKVYTEEDCYKRVRLHWKEAYILTMLVKAEMIRVKNRTYTRRAYTRRDSDYLKRLNAILIKVNECHFEGLKCWFKTIESDDPTEWNMFKLYSKDDE